MERGRETRFEESVIWQQKSLIPAIGSGEGRRSHTFSVSLSLGKAFKGNRADLQLLRKPGLSLFDLGGLVQASGGGLNELTFPFILSFHD